MAVQQTHPLRDSVCLLDGTKKIFKKAGLILSLRNYYVEYANGIILYRNHV